MDFQIIGNIENVRVIAKGRQIRELPRLSKIYGSGKWRKLKGFAQVRLSDGTICRVELHWYELHGLGRKEFKIKRLLSEQ